MELLCLRIRDGELSPRSNHDFESDQRQPRAPRKEGDEEGSDEDSEEEESEEEEEESEEEPEVAGGSNEPELTRAERRDLKKKQAAAKQKGSGDEEDDEDLINTNHVEKKLNIADLGKDRQLSRRER